MDETNEALAKQEKELNDAEQEMKKLNHMLAVSDQVQAQLAEKVQSLEKKLEQSVQMQHEADKRAAIAETRCTEFEKQLLKREKKEHPSKEKKTKQG